MKHQQSRASTGTTLRTLSIAPLAILMLTPPLQGTEIFSDGFESGDLGGWSSSAGGDCEIVQSETPNCDFDTEIGPWTLSNPADISFVSGDDSDGDPTSGSVEMIARANETSMTLCFPRLSTGTFFMTSQLDGRLVSGTVTSCEQSFSKYSGTDCTGSGGTLRGSVSGLTSTWRTRRPGGTLATEGIQSFRVTIRCTGDDATVRFDDIVVTALMVQLR